MSTLAAMQEQHDNGNIKQNISEDNYNFTTQIAITTDTDSLTTPQCAFRKHK